MLSAAVTPPLSPGFPLPVGSAGQAVGLDFRFAQGGLEEKNLDSALLS